jgi:hypothetical protein
MAWVKLTNTNNHPVYVNLDNFHIMAQTGSSEYPCTDLISATQNTQDPKGVYASFMMKVRETPEPILRLADPVL